jgi:hypothetical protein
MGVHTGEAAQTAAAGMLGLDVHRAARIAAAAYGGQIVLSEAAAVLMRDWLPDGAVLTDLGARRLKDLGRPEELFQLSAPGLQGNQRLCTIAGFHKYAIAQDPLGHAPAAHARRPRPLYHRAAKIAAA